MKARMFKCLLVFFYFFRPGLSLAEKPKPKLAAFEPATPEEQGMYRIDAQKLYGFALTEEYWQKIAKLYDEVATFKGKLRDPNAHLAFRKANARLNQAVFSLKVATALLTSQDTTKASELDRKLVERINPLYNEKIAWADREITSITMEEFDQMAKKVPELEFYRWDQFTYARRGAHTLSEEVEKAVTILGQSHGIPSHWYADELNRMPWPDLMVDGKKVNLRSHFGLLFSHPDRKIRKDAWIRYLTVYRENHERLGQILIDNMRATNDLSVVYGFPNGAVEEMWHGFYLTPEEGDRLFAAVDRGLPVYQEYLTLTRGAIAKNHGLKKFEPWDRAISAQRQKPPRHTVAQAIHLVNQAVGGFFGGEYAEELSAYMNPKNNRIDFFGGPNRERGGFSCLDPSAPSWFYSRDFSGELTDAFILAHEGGHITENELQKRAGTDWHYSVLNTPIYLLEAPALLNESLLYHHLYTSAKTDEERLYFLQELLDNNFSLYNIVAYGRFEVEAYKGVKAGQINKPMDLNKLWKEVSEPIDPLGWEYPELVEVRWSQIHHFFTQPLYYPNYILGQLISTSLFAELIRHPEAKEKYIRWLKKGFTASPRDLLLEFGIDLLDPDIAQKTFGAIQPFVEEFRTLLKKQIVAK